MNVSANITLTYPELKNVCRICLKKEQLYDLFNIIECGTITIKEIIENLTGDILSRNDETPDKICNQCVATLSNINTFLNTYKSTKSLFEDVIRQHWASISDNANSGVENTLKIEPLENAVLLSSIKSEPVETDHISHSDQDIDIETTEIKLVKSEIESEGSVVDSYNSSEVPIENNFLGNSKCKFCNFNCTDCSDNTDGMSYDQKKQKVLLKHYKKTHFIDIHTNFVKCIKCETGFVNIDMLLAHYDNEKCKLSIDNAEELHSLKNRIKSEKRQKQLLRVKTYNCLQCDNLLLSSFDEMITHFHEKHRTGSHVCMLCNTLLSRGMFLHLMGHRPQWMKFYCKNCYRLFESTQELLEHEKNAGHKKSMNTCPVCKREFPRKKFCKHWYDPQSVDCANEDLKLTNQQKIPKLHTCKVCHKQFRIKQSLIHHRKANHQGSDFNCEKCFKKFTRKEALEKHMKRMHSQSDRDKEEQKFSCAACGTKFTSSKTKRYKCHLAYHKLGHKVICSLKGCDDTFPSKIQLNAHLIEKHNAFSCHYCYDLFHDWSVFKAHYHVHLWEKSARKSSNSCRLCSETFANKETLIAHAVTQHWLHLCSFEDCFEVFVNREGFDKHQNNHIQQRSNVKCQICGRPFKNSLDRARHEMDHKNRTMYPCGICSYVFRYENRRTAHIRSHNEENSCRFCDRTFLYTNSKEAHEQLHADNNAFGCPYCRDRFQDRMEAERHINQHLQNFS